MSRNTLWRKKTPLTVPEGNVNTVVYRDILETQCLPYAIRVYGNNFQLQDDNARPHRALLVREFLDAEDVQQMPWPDCSPDTNPIEHAWDALDGWEEHYSSNITAVSPGTDRRVGCTAPGEHQQPCGQYDQACGRIDPSQRGAYSILSN